MKIKRLREDSIMARILAGVAAAVIRYRRLFLYPQIVLFVLCGFYTVRYLQFDTSRDNLVGANKSDLPVLVRDEPEPLGLPQEEIQCAGGVLFL